MPCLLCLDGVGAFYLIKERGYKRLLLDKICGGECAAASEGKGMDSQRQQSLMRAEGRVAGVV